MTNEFLMFILRVKCSFTKKLERDLFGMLKTSLKTCVEDLLWGGQVLVHEAWLPWDFDIVVVVVKKIPEDADDPHFHISFKSLQP